jgi:hypothetical protein
VVSHLQPANNASLHATLQKRSMKDYWQLDVDEMDAAARADPYPPPPEPFDSGSPLP